MNERKNRKFIPVKRVILVIIFVVLLIATYNLVRFFNVKRIEYNDKKLTIENLNNEIKAEEDKIKQIDNSRSESITNEEYESLAREELGLIKKDEIVIRPR